MALSQKDKQEICDVTAYTIVAIMERYKNLIQNEKAIIENNRQKVTRRLYAYPILKRNVENYKLDIADLQKEEFKTSPAVRHIQAYWNNDLTADDIREIKTLEIEQAMYRDEQEIAKIDRALAEIQDDAFYEIIPALYFYKTHVEALTNKLYCNRATIYRHKKRLLDKLSICLYGAEAL